MPPPFDALTYLYAGTSQYPADLAYHRDVLGAELVWEFHEFGAHVAALRHGPGPLFLLADHRPGGTIILIHAVKDLEATTRALTARGWKKEAGPFEVPDGPCVTFKDPSGREFGLLQMDRPHVLESQYARPGPKPKGGPRRRS